MYCVFSNTLRHPHAGPQDLQAGTMGLERLVPSEAMTGCEARERERISAPPCVQCTRVYV